MKAVPGAVRVQHELTLRRRNPHVVGYSTLLLTISIPATYDPSLLAFPTPLFPDLDPRTAPAGTQGLVMQMWRINVENYGDDAVKGAGQKGYFGFVRPASLSPKPRPSLRSQAR